MGARVVVIGFMIAALIAGSMVVRARGRTTAVASAQTRAVQPPTTVTVVAARRAQVTARGRRSGLGGEHSRSTANLTYGYIQVTSSPRCAFLQPTTLCRILLVTIRS
jgi:hypothetical protein